MSWQEVLEHTGSLNPCADVWERMRQALPQYLWMDKEAGEGWCTGCRRWVGLESVAHVPYSLADAVEENSPWEPFGGWSPMQIRTEYDPASLRHLRFAACPECGALVQMRDIWRGRRSMKPDRLFCIEWRKSRREPETALVMVAYEVTADWASMDSYDPAEEPITMTPMEVVLLQWGKPGQRWRYTWRYDRGWAWTRNRQCESGYSPGRSIGNPGIRTVLDVAAYEDALEGTRQGTVVELLHERPGMPDAECWHDRITYLTRINRHGCIEYLARLGMQRLAMEAIDGNSGGLLNLRGKTARAVLRLTEGQWAEVKGKKLEPTPDALRMLRVAGRHNLRMNVEAACWLGEDVTERYGFESLLNENLRHPDPMRALKYCRKRRICVGDYRDMYREMMALGMDVSDRQLLYPTDFWQAHQRYSERLAMLEADKRAKGHAQDTAMIRRRIEEGTLDGYFFGALGLTMRPMMSASEIISEGTAQRCCVGGYVATYAKGNDILCVVRSDQQPDKSLYTVEFTPEGELVQCRGYRNKTPEGEAKAKMDLFWRLWRDAFGQWQQQTERKEKTA